MACGTRNALTGRTCRVLKGECLRAPLYQASYPETVQEQPSGQPPSNQPRWNHRQGA
jgi:hypothetical protein